MLLLERDTYLNRRMPLPDDAADKFSAPPKTDQERGSNIKAPQNG
jgi:hypothetical protein